MAKIETSVSRRTRRVRYSIRKGLWWKTKIVCIPH